VYKVPVYILLVIPLVYFKIALVITGNAVFEDIYVKEGLCKKDCSFGSFVARCVLHIYALVFCRGIMRLQKPRPGIEVAEVQHIEI
jgi:hypothetical protein